MKVSKNIRMFEGAEFSSNCYLILEKPVFLVDTGDGSNKEKLLEFIKRYIDEKELKYIVNTHSHFDHTGANEFIREKTGAEILKEQDLKGKKKIGSFEIIETPGHHSSAVCLYNKEKKILISGDTIFSTGSVGRTDIGGNPENLKKSVKKLSELDVKILLTGHGEPALENGNEIINKALSLVKNLP
ncbi:MAG: MBL fold metallo-hydrolase [Candidatus Undinarchaeales archaeon]